ncbi:MarR family transcriptional regulator [Clostridium sp. JS66]|uniref:MarR family winged helix-turn-helix transcriptional regulator n=1 Tax=Clostridium sp. JS66 TaxID=3064705 RepID=UPI00298E7DF3|nr:MarR family transcriptional regulator [Clostridium sp. JS66]WPC43307.1 MarR family transcriptional regulator [Clostridium sp. JS66]
MYEESKKLDDNRSSSLRLLEVISKTSNMVQKVLNKFYKELMLSETQFSALYLVYLAGDDGITLSTLGEKMNVTRANITTLVDRMVSRGLIERIINESDRRSIKAVVTDNGKEIFNSILPKYEEFTSVLLNFLTENEKKRFNELLLKIQEELTKNYLND